eukprot:TRINITY_DN23303_c0_g1_i1.p1 TRINITY_DN23303_c0_g1~~TRINITY_DN23303_c0_g1_i1.p1  ORF type:complete len:315 (+),score=68.43 TRINITY_DN23303_c0_g1_i1:64-945(+)
MARHGALQLQPQRRRSRRRAPLVLWLSALASVILPLKLRESLVAFLPSSQRGPFFGHPKFQRLPQRGERQLSLRRQATLGDLASARGGEAAAAALPAASLAAAVVQGKPDEVRQLLRVGVPLEDRGARGRTALAFAANKGSTEMVQMLCEAGADLETADESGRTPLALAAAEGHHAVVADLVHRGANVNALDRGGLTALHWAAVEGHDLATKVLVDAGAEVEAADFEGMTALKLAAVFGHAGVARELVRGGADPLSALALARRIQHESTDVVELLASAAGMAAASDVDDAHAV